MPAQRLGELPTETLPTVELPNPVLMPDVQFSKDTFNAAMEAEKSKPAETETPATTPDFPPTKEPEAAPEVKPEPIPEPATTADKIEIPPETPASKATLPEELLTGKKPEPKVDEAISEIDAMVLPKNAKPEQVANFNKLKETAKREIESKLARINELESKTSEGASRHEIEAAQERIKAAEEKALEFEKTIERLAFTESPRFKYFQAKENAILEDAKSYLEGTDIDPSLIDWAARTKGAQRVKIIHDNGLDVIAPYLVQFDVIQREKDEVMENWKVEAARQSEVYKAQQDAQAEQRRKAEDEVWSQVQTDLSNLVPYRKFEKNDSWNSRADELLAKAKTVYNGDGVDLKEVGTIIGKGMAYDALDEVRVALTEELNRVVQENAKLKSAKPGASNGQVAAASNNANLSPMDQAKARFNQEMGAARGQ